MHLNNDYYANYYINLYLYLLSWTLTPIISKLEQN